MKIVALRRLKNAILNLMLAKNRVTLLTFQADLQIVVDNLSHPKSTLRPTMVGLEKNFQNGGSHTAKKSILRLVFANTVFHKRRMLQIFYAEYTEIVLDILSYPESTMGPP